MRVPVQARRSRLQMNMTPMIDVVFQLLVFFIMTFKIVALEGDFNVRMPLASEVPPEQTMEDVPTLISTFGDPKTRVGHGKR